MRYDAASKLVLTAAAAAGDESYVLGTLLAAHAIDVLDPDQLGVSGSRFTYKGAALLTLDPVAAALGVPGVRLVTPVMVQTSGTVDPAHPSKGITSNFHNADIGAEIGSRNVAFLDELAALWVDKIAPAGAVTDYQLGRVLLLLRCGILVIPSNQATLSNYHYPVAMQTIGGGANARAAWDLIATQFKLVMKTYLAKNLEDAAAQAKSAAFWASVADVAYASVEAVRDLPANAVVGAGKVGWFALSNLGGANLAILGVVGVGVAAYFLLPQLAAARALTRKAA